MSSAQAAAWSAGRRPTPEEVAPDVWAVAVPIPEGTIPHTLSYVLLSPDGGVHVIDPGWDHPDVIHALTDALSGLDRRLEDVRTVIATHFHPDHLGAAGRLREISGAEVMLSATEREVLAQETAPARLDLDAYASVLDAWEVPGERREELSASFGRPSLVDDLEPSRMLGDGDTVVLAGHVLGVVQTPGHTSGHICLIDDGRRVLYSGDHVLPGIYSGIGIGTLPGSDPLGDYLDSLDRLAPFDEFTVLPGHEFRFSGLGERRRQIAEHHLTRTREVAALVDELGDASVWDYARRVTWTSGWNGLTGFWLHSALRQTELHRDFVRSGRSGRRLTGDATDD
ncbi:MBL fold metallo-hydrolase [uncultured Microbacterium sp.]|uniref:MBL fold metallo-hydrolase n=1 Tax=uncultured Microbacterium sp. TaxID=191216 RepID=UPI0035C952B0